MKKITLHVKNNEKAEYILGLLSILDFVELPTRSNPNIGGEYAFMESVGFWDKSKTLPTDKFVDRSWKR